MPSQKNIPNEQKNIEKNVANGGAAVDHGHVIRQTEMLLQMLNNGRAKPVIPDQGITTTENQAIILGNRLEHVGGGKLMQ